ncbi:MAG: hypothetical protein H7328_04450 [Bdellovibrio sp.]|nr:hypothetical protein [Bdellovibrio sp.]
MRFVNLAMTILSLATCLSASAAERLFQVFSVKQITPLVDRYYGQDGNAFATLFCSGTSAEAMFVDSRLPDLDGKVFHFASLDACNDSRVQVRESYRKCKAELVIDQNTVGARVNLSHCK